MHLPDKSRTKSGSLNQRTYGDRMTLPLVIFLAISCLVAVVVPWMGVVIYYVMAVGQLTAFYPHHFGENRIFLFMSLATLAGLGIATAARQVDWRRLLHYPSLLMFLLVVVVNFSAGISPFQEFEDVKRGVLSPVELLETFNKIMLYYFVAVLLIDTRAKLVTIISVVGTCLLYTSPSPRDATLSRMPSSA